MNCLLCSERLSVGFRGEAERLEMMALGSSHCTSLPILLICAGNFVRKSSGELSSAVRAVVLVLHRVSHQGVCPY